MMLAEDVANSQIADLGARLNGGRALVFDATGNELAACAFADPAFRAPAAGRASAYPLAIGAATADGAPSSYEAYDRAGQLVAAGSAGYKDADPAPEMKFKVRQIVRDADVVIDTFEIGIQNIIPLAGVQP